MEWDIEDCIIITNNMEETEPDERVISVFHPGYSGYDPYFVK